MAKTGPKSKAQPQAQKEVSIQEDMHRPAVFIPQKELVAKTQEKVFKEIKNPTAVLASKVVMGPPPNRLPTSELTLNPQRSAFRKVVPKKRTSKRSDLASEMAGISSPKKRKV
ncbi:MAG: hypothetical protein AB7V32_01010 [Candidatus Berkiella sp.]